MAAQPSAVAALLTAFPSSAGLGATNNGWFYEVLVKAGLSHGSAHTVVTLVLRPLEIVLLLLAALLVAHFGAKAVRAFLGHVAGPALHRSESRRADARLAPMVSLAANGWGAAPRWAPFPPLPANVWGFAFFLMSVFLILGLGGLDRAPLLARSGPTSP